ncbi:MAG: hypothetical protein U1E80_05730 [Piscinibacter sp.]
MRERTARQRLRGLLYEFGGHARTRLGLRWLADNRAQIEQRLPERCSAGAAQLDTLRQLDEHIEVLEAEVRRW